MTGWPVNNDASWILNLLHDRKQGNERLTTMLAAMTADRDGARAELDALRKSAESSDAPSPDPCSYCLWDMGVDKYGSGHLICLDCYNNVRISWRMVRDRVAARLASCPTRRTSPDPLAVHCQGCCSPIGTSCTGPLAEVAP